LTLKLLLFHWKPLPVARSLYFQSLSTRTATTLTNGAGFSALVASTPKAVTPFSWPPTRTPLT
jgi:hypothetical protein